MAIRRLLLLPALAAASWDDSEVFLQKSQELQKSADTTILGLQKDLKELADFARTAPRPEMSDDLKAEMSAFKGLSPITQEDEDKLLKGWHAFYDEASKNADATPEELLRQAQSALVQTGAWESLRSMAKAANNGTRSQRGATVLDSMILGFSSSIAPWANLLRAFHAPLIKVKFELFANFFGPGGDAGRLCIGSSSALDSRYATFDDAEFGGVSFFAGPAKWDNVPGWSFGSMGGFDNAKSLDVADFGWKWTFAHSPQTVMFYWDMMLLGSKGLQTRPALLQTDSNGTKPPCSSCYGDVPSSLTMGPPGPARHPLLQYPTHSSTFFGHVWCNPDWTNTPMVLETPIDVANEVPYPKEVPGVPATAAPSIVDPEADAI